MTLYTNEFVVASGRVQYVHFVAIFVSDPGEFDPLQPHGAGVARAPLALLELPVAHAEQRVRAQLLIEARGASREEAVAARANGHLVAEHLAKIAKKTPVRLRAPAAVDLLGPFVKYFVFRGRIGASPVRSRVFNERFNKLHVRMRNKRSRAPPHHVVDAARGAR